VPHNCQLKALLQAMPVLCNLHLQQLVQMLSPKVVAICMHQQTKCKISFAAHTFCHPHPWTAISDKCDLIKAAGVSTRTPIASERTGKHLHVGTLACCATHKWKHILNAVMHGALKCGKSHGHALTNCTTRMSWLLST